MIVFWRDAPLSSDEKALLSTIEEAHRRSALRDNGSTLAVKNSAGGSGSLECAISSALLCLGNKHAPIRRIYRLLKNEPDMLLEEVSSMLHLKQAIPGWGSSFFKNRPDPDWESSYDCLKAFPEWRVKIESVTAKLHACGKPVYPNAGCFTTTAALVLGIPEESASFLLINSRLPIWTALFQKAL